MWRLVALPLLVALQALARVRASQRPGPGARRDQPLAPEPRALVLALRVRDVQHLARAALHHRARGAPRRVHDVRDAPQQAASVLQARQREPAQQVARRAERAQRPEALEALAVRQPEVAVLVAAVPLQAEQQLAVRAAPDARQEAPPVRREVRLREVQDVRRRAVVPLAGPSAPPWDRPQARRAAQLAPARSEPRRSTLEMSLLRLAQC